MSVEDETFDRPICNKCQQTIAYGEADLHRYNQCYLIPSLRREKYLIDNFPELFSFEENGEISKHFCGIDYPDSYHEIILNLFKCIQQYQKLMFKIEKDEESNVYVKIYPPKVSFEQIKTKFGQLRIYCSGGNDTISGMINFASYLCDNQK